MFFHTTIFFFLQRFQLLFLKTILGPVSNLITEKVSTVPTADVHCLCLKNLSRVLSFSTGQKNIYLIIQ